MDSRNHFVFPQHVLWSFFLFFSVFFVSLAKWSQRDCCSTFLLTSCHPHFMLTISTRVPPTNKKYKEICRMNCQIGYRNFEIIWLMKELQQSPGETQSKEAKRLPSHLMNFQWSREQKWNQVRVSTSVKTHFPKDPNCEMCMKTKLTRASCRRRAGTVVPRVEQCGDLITADQKIVNEESESRNNNRYAVVAQDLATRWLQSYPCKTKTSQETHKSQMKFLEPTRKPKTIYTTMPWNMSSPYEE